MTTTRRTGGLPTELDLGGGLALPLTAVTETFAILAKRGAGKTNTAVVLTEEMVGAGQQVVVLDPTGVWWGLRSAASGRGGGLPVVIVGGDHADLPLQQSSGRAVAQLLVAERTSTVLDLSGLSKVGARELVADFLEELYAVNRAPLHLVVDEADLFAPQRQPKNMVRLAGAMEDIARRGRAHGIGLTLICQRVASLSWDVLSQAEVLVALRVTNPRDVGAIEEWIKLHADVAEARDVKASLPSLPIGTAWVWSPGWLETLQRVPIRARRTFDFSATPVPGSVARAPQLVAVDVDGLRAQLLDHDPTPPVDDVVAGNADPGVVRRLREQVRGLTRDLDTARAQTTPAPQEIPVLDEAGRSALTAAVTALQHSQSTVADMLAGLGQLLDAPRAATVPAAGPSTPRPPRGETLTRASRQPRPAVGAPEPVGGLKAGAVRMLHAMVDHHPLRLSRSQLATLAGMKVTGGTFGTYLSALRRGEYLNEVDHLLEVTELGLRTVGGAAAAPSTAEQVRQRWRSALKGGARRMLDELVELHPQGVSRRELAERVDIEVSGGTFGTHLSMLRSNGLLTEVGGQLHAADVLFLTPGGAR